MLQALRCLGETPIWNSLPRALRQHKCATCLQLESLKQIKEAEKGESKLPKFYKI